MTLTADSASLRQARRSRVAIPSGQRPWWGANSRGAAWRLQIVHLLVLLGALCAPVEVSLHAAPAVKTVYRFATQEQVAVLTFDAGDDAGYMPTILDTLAAHDVRASFGLTGQWAAAHPDLVQRLVGDGHHLINHTWSHRSFTGVSTRQPPLPDAERANELTKTEALIRRMVDVDVRPYFRPPYGDLDRTVDPVLAAHGYSFTIMWTIDTLGWKGLTVAQITRRVLDQVVPGAIILMHVGAGSQDGPALPGLLAQLEASGYRFATVHEMAQPRRAFPGTEHALSGPFLSYWGQHGGLPVFGVPLSGELQERDPDTGRLYTVQYLERQRFEWHPENRPPYQVLLGRLGAADAQRRGLEMSAPFRRLPSPGNPACLFFEPTGHHLCGDFRVYWQGHGLDLGDAGISEAESLALFGYPLSEAFGMTMEDGTMRTVQYFERTRLEWHPHNQPPYDILLGRLGADLLPDLPPSLLRP